MTNVSLGDLALCIGDQNPHRGKTCTVIGGGTVKGTELGNLVLWHVEFPKPVMWTYEAQQPTVVNPHLATIGWMPDIWMRKLSGPGMECEVLRHWLAPPGERRVIAKPRRYIGVEPLSNKVFPDISETDRAAGRVNLRKLYTSFFRGPL